jgi:hypothetical protein
VIEQGGRCASPLHPPCLVDHIDRSIGSSSIRSARVARFTHSTVSSVARGSGVGHGEGDEEEEERKEERKIKVLWLPQ